MGWREVKKQFTHYGWFYGVPVYLRFDGDGADVAGRNIFFDVLVEHLCPLLHAVVSFCYEAMHGEPMEGFMFRVGEEIEA